MDEKEQLRLFELTKRLLDLNIEAQHFYVDHARKEGYKPDFYRVVRPFANEVKAVSEEWLPLAQQFVQQRKPFTSIRYKLRKLLIILRLLRLNPFTVKRVKGDSLKHSNRSITS